MRDEETGSWWQQVTGQAIQGPLKGQKLRSFFHDEMTFALWKQEKPAGRVLRPDASIERAGEYPPANWEEQMARVPVTTSATLDTALESRALIVGVTISGASRAYPFDSVLKQSPILDELGRRPILIVVGDDKKSIRAFGRTVNERKLEFFVKPNESPFRLVDAETGSEWDFSGKAVSGLLSGTQLTRIPVLNDYWFDWKAYNPNTTIYRIGDR